MLKFSTRGQARAFAKGNKKIVDLHKLGQTTGKRWAVKIL